MAMRHELFLWALNLMSDTMFYFEVVEVKEEGHFKDWFPAGQCVSENLKLHT